MNVFKRMVISCTIFWQMVHVGWQSFFGVWHITTLSQPIVTIFGGSRIKSNDLYAQKAEQLAQRLINANISVITGGGGGIMEATSRGAVIKVQGKGKTVGISLKGLEDDRNPFAQSYFKLDYLYARKVLLTHFSKAFIIFPGGFGTLDELAEVLTLIQTKRIASFPIILVGTEFWAPFMAWIQEHMLKHELILAYEVNLVTILDDVDEVFKAICTECGDTALKK